MTEHHVSWLRMSYWVGAIVDALAALAMLDQAVLGRPSPLSAYIPEVPYRYAMGLAGSLMVGWTVLLLWADRKPGDRSDVLMITNVVIVGLFGSGVYAALNGLVPWPKMGPLLGLQLSLLVLFTISYIRARGSPTTRK